MKSADEIKRIAKKIRINKTAVNKDRILADAQTALKNSKKAKPADTRPNIRRIIMKINRFWKTVIFVFLVINIYSFAPRIHARLLSINKLVYICIDNPSKRIYLLK